MAELVDELLMGNADANAPNVMPQGNQDAEGAVGEAAQATQRITDTQKAAVHEHFLVKSAERWNTAQKKQGLEAMISAAAVVAGVIYATLKLSQLKTQHANYRAAIMYRNKCGTMYSERTLSLINDVNFLLLCAFDLCGYVFNLFSASHKHFQVLPKRLYDFLQRMAALHRLIDEGTKTAHQAFDALTRKEKKTILDLAHALEKTLLPTYLRMWREVIVMENGETSYGNRPDLAAGDIEFILSMSRDIARRDITSPLFRALTEGTFLQDLFIDILPGSLYQNDHVDLAAPVKKTFPPYMMAALANDKVPFLKLFVILMELRFYHLYMRRVRIGSLESWLADSGGGDEDGDGGLSGGTLEVLSYRGGWALYEALGVWVPKVPIYSEATTFQKNAEACGAVVKSLTMNLDDAKAAGVPTTFQVLKKKSFIPSIRLYRLLVKLECDIFNRYMSDITVVTAMGMEDFIKYLRLRLHGHDSYHALTALIEEAFESVETLSDDLKKGIYASSIEIFVDRFWEAYYDGSVVKKIEQYFNYLLDPDVDPIKKMAFRLQVLTKNVEEDDKIF